MNVAFLLSFFPKLSETFILNQITGLLDNGHDVTIIARRRGDRAHPAVEEYQLASRAHYWPKRGARLGASMRALGRLWSQASDRGALLGALGPFGGPKGWALTCTTMTLESRRFDIVHCHFGPTAFAGSLLKAARVIDAPLVTSFYGNDVTRVPLQRGGNCYARVFQYSDRVLVLSEHMGQRIVELGCTRDRVVVQHLGVNVEQFPFRERPTPAGPIRLLSVGRLIEKKGLEYAIRATAQTDNVEYRIIGDGPLRNELEELSRELGVDDRVSFLGTKLRAEVNAEMAGAHIFLAPSVRAADGDEEGTPTVIVEAMASGLPVLATRHSGIPEQVSDGVSGFLVEERDVAGLAERLRMLQSDAELRGRMGRAGAAHAETEFNSQRLTAKLISLYSGLLGS